MRPITRVAAILLSLLVLLLAGRQISYYQLYGDIRYWAYRIERGQTVGRDIVSRLAREAELMSGRKDCQSDFVKNAMIVVLLDLDYQNQLADYDAWSISMQRAETFLTHALSCLPTDGNIWLRLAMVKQAIAERPDEVSRLLTFSQLYAPAEEDVIEGRFRTYDKLSALSLRLTSVAIERDLRAICSTSGKALLARLPKPGPRMNEFIARTSIRCFRPVKVSMKL